MSRWTWPSTVANAVVATVRSRSSTSAFGSNASTARVRAASTTSGLSTSLSMAAKIAVFAAAMGTFNALAHTDGPRLWWAVHA